MRNQEQGTAKVYTPSDGTIYDAYAYWAADRDDPTVLAEITRWFSSHDRVVAAKALEDAADDAASKEMTDGYGVSIWLRARAAVLRVQGETKP
jgi:hypothetical protein